MDNSDILEFVIFYCEIVAKKINKTPSEVFRLLNKNGRIITSYLVPKYEILRHKNKDYVADEIIKLMKDKNII